MAGDGLAVQGGGDALAASEKFVPFRRMDKAELHGSVAHKGDGHAPVRHARNEGLGAVDRVRHPDPLAFGKGGDAGFFAEESILGEGGGDAGFDEEFGVQVGFADHILRALVLDCQAGQVVKITAGQGTRLHGSGRGCGPIRRPSCWVRGGRGPQRRCLPRQ